MKEPLDTKLNRHLNFAIDEFMSDFPEVTLEELCNGISDTLSDLTFVYKQARAKYGEGEND